MTFCLTSKITSVSPVQFGAVFDGITCDADAISKAANVARAMACGLSAPAGVACLISKAVNLTGIGRINFGADIEIVSAGAVDVGGFSGGNQVRWEFSNIQASSTLFVGPVPDHPYMRVTGFKSGSLRVGSCNYLQFWADETIPGQGSNGYSPEILLTGVTRKCEITDGGGHSWCNEMTFRGGRISELAVKGVGYAHNHLKFLDSTFEGENVKIDLQKCHHVRIERARFENVSNAPGVFMGADTYSCDIEATWSGVGSPRADFNIPLSVDDRGLGNSVRTERMASFRRKIVFSLNAGDTFLSNENGCCTTRPGIAKDAFAPFGAARITPHFDKYKVGPWQCIGLSGFLPVSLGQSFGFEAQYSDSLMRAVIYVYDAQMRPILSDDDGLSPLISFPGMTVLSKKDGRGYYAQAANMSADAISQSGTVIGADVAYIRLALVSGSSGGDFTKVAAFLWCPPSDLDDGPPDSTPLTLDGPPIKGTSPVGTVARDGTVRRICVASDDAVMSGSTGSTISVLSEIDAAPGDVVGWMSDTGDTLWSLVTASGPNTIEVDRESADALPDGRIFTARWMS
jgi:hypothetical protein